ncbi:MAG: hypothetical protein AB8F26_10705 [Phycisphaerales bacterium]
MNEPKMNTQDLIELSTLHALGMLEDDERAAYESALESAAPAIRQRVFAEARRMADLGDLLPDEEPSSQMRDMVLAAVRAAMREQEVEQRLATGAIAGRIQHQPIKRAVSQPSLPRGNRVHAVWRAAAIGLAAATVALTVVAAQNREVYNQLDNELLLSQAYDTMGAEFVKSMIMDENSTRVAFSSVSNTANANAAVWHNADWNTALLFVDNLKPAANADPYRLVVLDSDGNIVREVTEFVPTGELETFKVKFNPATDARLAIYESIADTLAEQPLLSSPEIEL